MHENCSERAENDLKQGELSDGEEEEQELGIYVDGHTPEDLEVAEKLLSAKSQES